MLKNFAFLTVTGLLASACILSIGDSDSATTTDTSAGSTSGGSSTSDSGTTSTTDGTTSPTTTDASTTATTSPTTGPTTTDATTTDATTTQGTTTSGGNYGKCGWHPDKYYACESAGGVPSAIDPDGISPIDCPDTLPAEGDKCDETTPVNYAGCCLADGTNWYCSNEGTIIMEACGA